MSVTAWLDATSSVRAKRLVGNGTCYASSGADTGFKVSLGVQLLEGIQYRDTRDMEFGGEASGRRNALPGAELTGEYSSAKPGVELLIDRQLRGSIQGDGRKEATGGAVHRGSKSGHIVSR